jgi:hypothetical protein
MRRRARFMGMRALTAATLFVASVVPASAIDLVFAVITTDDKPDAMIGDGICADVDGKCTLRAAIQEANAHPGEDIINIIGDKDKKFPLKLVGANEDAAATGDLDITDTTGVLIIHGNEHAIIKGKKDRVFHILPGASLQLEGVGAANGSTLTKGVVVDPTTLDGGGILNEGMLDIRFGKIIGNKSQTDGGGIANRGTLFMAQTTVGKNKAVGDGGGLYNGAQVGGTADVNTSTFAKNQAGKGGGIDNQHTLTLSSVTVGANKAIADGAGINNHDGGTLTLQNVTVKDNKSKSKTVGGGVANGTASTATCTNTLVDSNKPANCAGTIASGGGNVENAATCGFGAGDKPNAGKLQMKGLKFVEQNPFTQTYLPKATSPAIDAGVDTGCPELDENFKPRIDAASVPNANNSICDSGAVEFGDGLF